MKRPMIEQMETAAEWLRQNEGPDGEGDACHAVAEWLERQARDTLTRDAAREAGVPVKMLRERLAANR